MPYKYETAVKIRNRVNEVGIYETSLEFGISASSVKRALRTAKARDDLDNPMDNCVINGGRKVLCVGDLHCPFDHDEYVHFLIDIYKKHNCDTVVFIGDVIDNHYASYHETDPDGMGGRDELDLAVQRLEPYYMAFPDAYVTIGNHDRLVMRKAMSGNVPKRWIKSYCEVLETPRWIFTDFVDIDNVQYIHGENGTAKTRSLNEMSSVVQGHRHTEMYTHWTFGKNRSCFGMQVGCGIDGSSYAMGYCKYGRKPAIGCGVIINGVTAFNEVLPL